MLIVEEQETFYLRKDNFPMREETYKIIGLAMKVHRILGKGFLEIVYKDAMEIEFNDHKVPFEREKPFIIIDYHGKNVPYRYMSDILLNKVLIA